MLYEFKILLFGLGMITGSIITAMAINYFGVTS